MKFTFVQLILCRVRPMDWRSPDHWIKASETSFITQLSLRKTRVAGVEIYV